METYFPGTSNAHQERLRIDKTLLVRAKGFDDWERSFKSVLGDSLEITTGPQVRMKHKLNVPLHKNPAASVNANDSPSRPPGHFESTLWTVVLQAGSTETTQSRGALEHLCRAYWHPLYCYVRRRGHSAPDAQDLVQGFFLALIRSNSFPKPSPDQGRFRAFLLASMNYFLSGNYDRHLAPRQA